MSINASYLKMLREQCVRWPKLTAMDLTKALYQAEFGCGHFVGDPSRALNWLKEEQTSLADAVRELQPPFIEPLGGAFCRVHLAHMKKEGLSPETLCRLFVLSARETSGDMQQLRLLLDGMEKAVESGLLPVNQASAKEFLAGYRAAGCPSTHHSEVFREAYQPAYRVIRADYARFLPLFCAIDRLMTEKQSVTVAIEGGSASGKSTLGALLQEVYGCNLFHMDDFFLQMHQRTPERFMEPGGNVDYERFKAEVLNPLKTGNPFSYRVFDCSVMALGETVHVQPGKLNIIEGAYSLHPYFGDAYDLSCFIGIGEAEQSARILARNGEAMHQRFFHEWIPMEKRYFQATDIRSRCTMIL